MGVVMSADKKYAIVGPDNRAINFILWNGFNEFDYGQANGNYMVLLDGIERYGFGWLYDPLENKFINPDPEPDQPE